MNLRAVASPISLTCINNYTHVYTSIQETIYRI